MDLDGGWDCRARLVDGRWIERTPRRPEVANQLRREAALMPWLAPRLPLRVPEPKVVSNAPLVLRHELVPGVPMTVLDATAGRTLGMFLRALHGCPVTEAIERGLPAAADTIAERGDTVNRFRAEVVPLLPKARAASALALLDNVLSYPADTIVHGDLGPEHVLTTGDGPTGVIDFGDLGCDDAALDLAWALHGTPAAFAEALASTYGVTGEQHDRALSWHQMGPWHEVTHGLDTDNRDSIRLGLIGVLDRITP